MIKLGEKQVLTVMNATDFGIYLGDADSEEKVLLPKKQVAEGTKTGDTIEVFIYRDSEDRLIATTREPMLCVGEMSVLKVKEVTEIGAFLDWGLEKDLLLPYKEQKSELEIGQDCPVVLYIDKSNRLCATMHVYDHLRSDSPYHKEDEVTGTVYELHETIGAFVAVDRLYHAVVPKKEIFEPLRIGTAVTARITSIREDGKLNLSLRKKAYLQMDEDVQIVLSVMDSYHGVLPYTDKSIDADTVMKEYKMSKNAFKRAVGRLLKEGHIIITDKTIEKVNDHKSE